MAQGKKHEPTEKDRHAVTMMKVVGIPNTEIARAMGLNEQTLVKYYKDDIEAGAIRFYGDVAKFIGFCATGAALRNKEFGATVSDCLRAAFFIGKTRMGLRETGEAVAEEEAAPVSISYEVAEPKKPIKTKNAKT